MKAALIIGINDYHYLRPLTGAVPDALAIEKPLESHADGTRNFDCKVLPSKPGEVLTEQLLRKAIADVFTKEVDLALLYYAGHGGQDQLGSYLCSQDITADQRGLSLNDVLAFANKSKAQNIVIILDCCYAGGAGEDIFMREGLSTLRDDVCVLCAARRDEYSAEEGGRGIFTSIICEGLAGAAADFRGHVTAASLYAHVDRSLGAWHQRPLFKANVSRLIPLRHCAPPIKHTELRELVRIFDKPDIQLELDPDYEPWDKEKRIEHGGSAEGDPQKASDFKVLLQCRDNGLVEPVDEPSLYYVAMNRKRCRLTPSGRYIWRLAKDNRI
jgi:hypothetical protein